jgi:hypothetical protein
MQNEKNANVSVEPKKRLFFCWNTERHPDYGEYKWEGTYNRNEIVFCPMCKQAHKVTIRVAIE